jgi:hypothetical protein
VLFAFVNHVNSAEKHTVKTAIAARGDPGLGITYNVTIGMSNELGAIMEVTILNASRTRISDA